DREHTRIAPIGIIGGIAFKRRHVHERFQHSTEFRLADTFHKILEAFLAGAVLNIAFGQKRHDFRDAFGRYGADRQSVSRSILLWLSATHSLEMGSFAFISRASGSI